MGSSSGVMGAFAKSDGCTLIKAEVSTVVGDPSEAASSRCVARPGCELLSACMLA